VLLNAAPASVAFLGAFLALAAGSWLERAVEAALVPIAAGGFVHLAAADLVPELQHDRGLRALLVQTSLICLGIGVMVALTFVE
jgi:zinc and cadmium transporter